MADSAYDPQAPVRAGWSAAEITWELSQAEAARLAAAGDWDAAAKLWGEALFLARENFPSSDPRLATSIANHAASLRRQGEVDTAAKMFAEALAVWDASGPWVDALAPERQARSSLFHLRMELRNREHYQEHQRVRFRALATQGRDTLARLAAGERPAEDTHRRWELDRPDSFSDKRKLLAAVLLVAPGLE